MEDKKKGWQGSDLVFDIDYDHLKRPTLKEAKKQSEKLLVILKDDLGFRKLLYVDSGSRGFHVHVHDECVQKLGNPERREIADFIGHYKTRRGRKIINPNWVEIDTVVTTDFTRLIRLPGSLNVKPDSARPCAIISGPKLLFDHGQISHCGAGFFRQFSPYKLAGQSQNMSWETFVVGTLEIVPRLSEEKKAKIIEEFEEILETDLIWDDPAKEYKVSHIN
jgi:DNA primase catalytic subunit